MCVITLFQAHMEAGSAAESSSQECNTQELSTQELQAVTQISDLFSDLTHKHTGGTERIQLL